MKMTIREKIMIAATVAVLVLAAGCSGGDKEAAAGGQPGGARPPAGEYVAKVSTVPAELKPIRLLKQYVGEIQPYYSVDVRSTASGWITRIDVDTGDRVNRDTVIVTIEHEEVQTQADQAQANIAVAKASVARAEAELENVVLETRRAETMYEKGYISRRDLEQAQTAEKQGKAALAAAEGQLAQAQAQLKNIQVKLRDTTVRAPFAGSVAGRYVDPGAYVSPSTSIVRLVDDSKVKAVVNVVEEDFPQLKEGAAATIISDSYPGRAFEGTISRISPAIDPVSRTAPVEILIPNEGGELRTGMTARVNLVVSERAEAVVLPEEAVRRDVESGTDFVFTVQDGAAKMIPVKTGIRSGGEVEIAGGLEAEREVVAGDTRLSEGMKVEVVNQGGESR